jgi:hypothetical protein
LKYEEFEKYLDSLNPNPVYQNLHLLKVYRIVILVRVTPYNRVHNIEINTTSLILQIYEIYQYPELRMIIKLGLFLIAY